ncbi:pyridoxamine 5'-phosphate oxidase family protein [Phenylobacterium immobile]|uniref:pyridoxamine 5'-phosphate oxidase family protein n=1 Tax=Phenylobacterium immobile TaxID=21 RepID=UPI000B1AD9E7|nr:pyridoxamine 5'-phosphate oxidase family protein [Phenylobacterium immobile]
MATPAEIEEKFWKALKSDRTVMLGLIGVEDGIGQPMMAQMLNDEPGDIYIFSSKDTDFVQSIGQSHPSTLQFAAKDHSLFAAVHGELVLDNNRETIEALWNPFVAAWFEGGKDDPKLQLLRFEPSQAQLWLNENSLFAGVRMLLGRDPKKDYAGKTATVNLQ